MKYNVIRMDENDILLAGFKGNLLEGILAVIGAFILEFVMNSSVTYHQRNQ